MGVMLNHLPKWCFYLRVGWLSQGWLIISRLADYLKVGWIFQGWLNISRLTDYLKVGWLSQAGPNSGSVNEKKTTSCRLHCLSLIAASDPFQWSSWEKEDVEESFQKSTKKALKKALKKNTKKSPKNSTEKNTELVQFQKPNFKSVCLLSRPAQWKPTITSTLLNNNELPTTIKSWAISNIWKETFPYIRECVTNCLWKLLGLRTSYISRPERPKAAKVQWPKAK